MGSRVRSSKVLHPELSYQLTGLLFKIHNALGRWRNEKQYADAFEEAMKGAGISYRREVRLPASFSGERSGRNVVDFLVDSKILLEFKAKPFTSRDDYAQVQRYLSALGIELGILVNFRRRTLLPRRILRGYSDHSGDIRAFGLRQGGFSLLELLIYVAVIGTVVAAVGAMFPALQRGRGNADARSEVNAELRFGMEKIAYDLRRASAVSTPATAGASAATLSMTVSGATVQYCVVSSRFYRSTDAACDGTGDDAITSPNVTVAAPTFTRLENTNTVLSKTVVSIVADLSMSYNSASPDWQYTERKKTTVALR